MYFIDIRIELHIVHQLILSRKPYLLLTKLECNTNVDLGIVRFLVE